ncbi:MAG: hypothetical protein H7239_04970 [Flavobacterium sp.]|nr:hypothetical protein [Flavobacterium sp.]
MSSSIIEINNIKKLSGYINYYGIKIDNYKIGLTLEENCVYLIEFQYRKDIYKKFS